MLRACGLIAFPETVVRRFQASSFRSWVDGERISKEDDAVSCLGNPDAWMFRHADFVSLYFVVYCSMQLFKDKYNHLEVPFGLFGLDVCEKKFSKVGGMISNERSYDGIDLVESAGALARIAKFEADPTGPRFVRAHKKQTHI